MEQWTMKFLELFKSFLKDVESRFKAVLFSSKTCKFISIFVIFDVAIYSEVKRSFCKAMILKLHSRRQSLFLDPDENISIEEALESLIIQ